MGSGRDCIFKNLEFFFLRKIFQTLKIFGEKDSFKIKGRTIPKMIYPATSLLLTKLFLESMRNENSSGLIENFQSQGERKNDRGKH